MDLGNFWVWLIGGGGTILGGVVTTIVQGRMKQHSDREAALLQLRLAERTEQTQLAIKEHDERGELSQDLHTLWKEETDKRKNAEAELDDWKARYQLECKNSIERQQRYSDEVRLLKDQMAELDRQRREAEQKVLGYENIKQMMAARGFNITQSPSEPVVPEIDMGEN